MRLLYIGVVLAAICWTESSAVQASVKTSKPPTPVGSANGSKNGKSPTSPSNHTSGNLTTSASKNSTLQQHPPLTSSNHSAPENKSDNAKVGTGLPNTTLSASSPTTANETGTHHLNSSSSVPTVPSHNVTLNHTTVNGTPALHNLTSNLTNANHDGIANNTRAQNLTSSHPSSNTTTVKSNSTLLNTSASKAGTHNNGTLHNVTSSNNHSVSITPTPPSSNASLSPSNGRSFGLGSTTLGKMGVANLNKDKLPSKGNSSSSTTVRPAVNNSHATQEHNSLIKNSSVGASPIANKTGASQQKQCVATAPRYNLNLDKMTGEWYPAKISKTTLRLWTQSFQKDHNGSKAYDTSCFLVKFNKSEQSDSSVLGMSLQKGKESTEVEAILIGDAHHPKASKWAISWPSGEDTLTSVVAAGVVGKQRSRYTWLLTVDCDLNGIVEPDWAVMARVPEGISNATSTAILAVVEGLKDLQVDNAITYQSDDCHK